MKRMRMAMALALVGLVQAASLGAQGASPSELSNRAERAIAAGNVVPERDLGPLVNVLRRPPSDVEDVRTAIDRIETLGDANGSSPAAVKHYLLEQATPLLLKIAVDGRTAFARGDAVMALRNMGASRGVLEQAATIAEQDRDSYVQSRGEILRNFIKSMPAEGAAAQVKSGGPREQQAIATLKARNLGVSADQLRRSSLEGNAADVQALLDAGVNVNSGSGLTDSALYFAVFSGCGDKPGETENLLKTVNVLVGAGADVKRKDDNGNNILLSAAQMCGPRIVTALIEAGADMKVTNGSGMTPLAMSLLMRHPDSAEVLVSKGARLAPSQVQMLSASVTDPRSKVIIQRAATK
jgi:hypothetical protein